MGRNIPDSRHASLAWMEAHINDWIANSTGIGLASASVLALATEIINARTAFTSVENARETAKTKTQVYYTKVDDARDKAADLVLSIKAFAENTDDPAAVYTLAGITGANPPGPVALPEQASILNAVLGGDGSVRVNFIGNGPAGTAWQVSRKLAGKTTFSYQGNADARTKSFVDLAIPTGTISAEYQIVGVRGSVFGPVSFAFAVTFGSADGAAAAA